MNRKLILLSIASVISMGAMAQNKPDSVVVPPAYYIIRIKPEDLNNLMTAINLTKMDISHPYLLTLMQGIVEQANAQNKMEAVKPAEKKKP